MTVEEVIRVCRGGEKVEIAPDAKIAVNKARAYIEKKLEDGAVIYGLTTGFGKFANVRISKEETARSAEESDYQSYMYIRRSLSERICQSGNAASL